MCSDSALRFRHSGCGGHLPVYGFVPRAERAGFRVDGPLYQFWTDGAIDPHGPAALRRTNRAIMDRTGT